METLVITRNRAFWETPAARTAFPHMLALPAYPSKLAYIAWIPRIIAAYLRMRPRAVIIGTTMPYARWAARLRRMGLLRGIKLITDNQFLSSADAAQFDAVWVYSRAEIELQDASVRDRFRFIPYPSKAYLVDGGGEAETEGYIFCGGNHKRDFDSVLDAMKDIASPLLLITGQPIDAQKLTPNITYLRSLPLDEYVSAMAKSLFVVVPLKESKIPHGHSDLSMAVSLGKALITTRMASAEDYVQESEGGLFVDPGDAAGYRAAIERMLDDSAFRHSCEEHNEQAARELSYEAFADKLRALVYSLI